MLNFSEIPFILYLFLKNIYYSTSYGVSGISEMSSGIVYPNRLFKLRILTVLE